MPLPAASAKRERAPTSSREAILDAPAAVSSEMRLAGTVARDTANATGIQSARFDGQFASKEDIFKAVMRIGIESVFSSVRAAIARRSHPPLMAPERAPYTQDNMRPRTA